MASGIDSSNCVTVVSTGNRLGTSATQRAIRTCFENAGCCEGDQCVSSDHVDIDRISIAVIKLVSQPLNNILFIFSMWNDNTLFLLSALIPSFEFKKERQQMAHSALSAMMRGGMVLLRMQSQPLHGPSGSLMSASVFKETMESRPSNQLFFTSSQVI